ncbi:MAG: hypothetical protein PHW04_18655 [Candidatus Wallbacteria bacterium]|nr:hypothetical protein [Candidatus Wallbacteria bacterium]
MNLGDLYADYFDPLTNYALSFSKDRDKAEQLVDETFQKALSNIHLLEILPEHKRLSWLFKTLKDIRNVSDDLQSVKGYTPHQLKVYVW